MWRQHGSGFASQHVPGTGGRHPLQLVLETLSRCRDEAPAPDVAGLVFVQDAALRESIRLDMSAAASAHRNGEWKAATVLAGAALEALLLYGILQKPPSEWQALAAAPKRDPENWLLEPLIDVAEALKLINIGTATLARLAKDFRNLIHPGRAQRLGTSCDKGTALATLAAVEHVARDLS